MGTRKKKKVLLMILTIISVLIIGSGSYTYYLWHMVTSTVANIEENIDRDKSEKRLEKINFKEGDPITVLLMGIDNPAGQKRGRSDSLILLTINPHSESMHMVSIPRDTYTKIKGSWKTDKINHAYAIGGTEMTIRSVENLLDVPVDYFVKVNMKSFKEIVDTVGGVEVNNDLDFTYYSVHYPKGRLHLDGERALRYSRMRSKDPRGDFGRQIRQRQVIEAIIQKGANISSITKFGEMIKVVENNVKTNLTFDDMWEIQSNYKDAQKNIEQHKIEGKSKEIKGTFYYIPDKENLRTVSNELKKHIEINNKTP
ncbi:LytR family transcriptional regulator [Peribacillus frigoritolerans]|uniref:polyisoprenyl-teichoic acid--peptidoglycan teichoic acid transferase TagU n=2 Tax=Peribacillus frigoritolerans TaxID=450367 RepID=UPI0023DBBC3C|nr:LytR family transcriptional regulator [Peribacillus frigoritolerans]MDF2000216.1 LytR family transcriptional regulator [Peribacillus frigoritolerans]